MLTEKLFRKFHTGASALSLGACGALAYFSGKLGYHLYLKLAIYPTEDALFLLIPLLITLCFITISYSMININIKGGVLGYILCGLRFRKIKKTNLGEKIYQKLNPKTLYSKDELEEKNAFSVFFKLLLKSSLIDLDNDNNEIGITGYDLNKSKIIKDYYLNYYVNDNNPILAKLIIRSLNWQADNCSYKTSFKNPDGYHFFVKLFELNPHFTDADQQLLNQFFKKYNVKKFKKANLSSIHFLCKKEVFSKLNPSIQNHILHLFELKIKNRDELLEMIQSPNNSTIPVPLVNEAKEPSINKVSYKNFHLFKETTEKVYEENIEGHEFLDKVQHVLLFKEQILSFLKINQDSQLQLFLTQDIDKIINSCNREMNVLHKMKVMNHPDLEKNKGDTLKSMNMKIESIIEKMNEQVSTIHQKLEEDLEIEKEVNNKVFSSRLN
jgi:hypothetical protein